MTGSPATPSFAKLLCPFVGLRSFREEDAAFFFGRERDIRVISSNVRATSLTVLYGPSGVGKSSVLQAGVIPFLKASSDTCVVYFNTWQGENFLDDLAEKCRRMISASLISPDAPADDLLKMVERWGERFRFLLVFDQFEEYLRYQPDLKVREKFESMLARMVNQEDLPGNVLIGIREDALWMLDQRFSVRIPNLLGNTLAIGHLTSQNAGVVIKAPIDRWNERYGKSNLQASIDPDLVTTLLDQVHTENVKRSESRGSARAGNSQEDRIEIAFLQLVLEELWMRETENNSFHLRLETLNRIGGAEEIVQTYVNDILNGHLDDRQRQIYSEMVRHLVTPSGAKFAQETRDLVEFAKAPAAEVTAVLNLLAGDGGSNRNLLRRFLNPEKYEIAHDILAQPILDWRLGYVQKKEREAEEVRLREEAERKQREQQLELEKAHAVAQAERLRSEEQARSAKRLRWAMASLVAVVALAAAFIIYAYHEQARFEALKHEAVQAAAAKAEAVLQAQRAEQERLAAVAEKAGNATEARKWRDEAEKSSAAAQDLKKSSDQFKQQNLSATSALERRAKDAEERLAGLQKQLQNAQEQNRTLQAKLDQLQRAGTQAERGPTPAPATQPPAGGGVAQMTRRALTGHTNTVTTVVFSPDGRMLASGGADQSIKLWDTAGAREIRTLLGHKATVLDVAFSSDGRTLASGSADGVVKLWEVGSGKEMRTISGSGASAGKAAFSPDLQTFAFGSRDGEVRLWDLASNKPISVGPAGKGNILSLAFSRNRILASGSRDSTISLWDTTSGKVIRVLTGHSNAVTSVAFSPDGAMLASAGADQTIKFWEVASGKEIRTIPIGARTFASLSFSPYGKLAAGGSVQGQVIVWEVATGKEESSIPGASGAVVSVAYSRDGRMLAFGGRDTYIVLWQFPR